MNRQSYSFTQKIPEIKFIHIKTFFDAFFYDILFNNGHNTDRQTDGHNIYRIDAHWVRRIFTTKNNCLSWIAAERIVLQTDIYYYRVLFECVYPFRIMQLLLFLHECLSFASLSAVPHVSSIIFGLPCFLLPGGFHLIIE